MAYYWRRIGKRLIGVMVLCLMTSHSFASSLTADFALTRATDKGDLSLRRIEIDSGFQGMKMLLFGARHDAGDIVVAVRGPEHSYMVRKKERTLGIWVNRDYQKFDGIYGYYSLASSTPLHDIGNDYLLKLMGIDINGVKRDGNVNVSALLSGAQPISKLTANDNEFFQAILNKGYQKHLYTPRVKKVSFIGDTLFRTIIDFPDNIPRGNYTAEVYLLKDGLLIGMESIPLRVMKRGFDAFIFDLAYKFPALYGIMAAICALLAGWIAGGIFKRV